MCFIITVPARCGGNLKITHTHTQIRTHPHVYVYKNFDTASNLKVHSIRLFYYYYY